MRAVELRTPRMVLRELTVDDVDSALAWDADPVAVRWMSHDVQTAEQERAYLARSVASAAESPRRVYDLAVESSAA